jgi:PTS system beta-glucosides-specific IIC component
MATTIDYRSLAGDIVREVGGEDNIASAAHCATRLRLRLHDDTKADKAAVEGLPGVITVVKAGGQFQVVVGDDVPKLYAAIQSVSNLGGDEKTDSAPVKAEGNLLNRFIDLVSSLLTPILWPLAGIGLLKAFLALFTTIGWLDPASTTYTILAAAADGLFFFLPAFLAITSAKRFGANQFTSLAIAAALLHPSLQALYASGEPVTFMGIPVTMMSYASSLLPIIVAVWLQSHLERFLTRVVPAALRNFTVPLVVVLVMVPLVLLTIGPATITASNWISAGVNAAFETAPWLAGAIMGGLWQVFVLFGLHWGFVPIFTNDLTTQGYTYLLPPLLPAVLAQAAAAFAVFLRTRNPARRTLAGPAALSGALAGITEPAIYGVTLPLKKPFYFGIAGGAIGGCLAGMSGTVSNAFVFPSFIALPAFTSQGNFVLLLIAMTVAMAVSFTLTWIFMDREHPGDDLSVDTADTPAATDVVATDTAGSVTILTPVAGVVVALTEVSDKVFSSGALGKGIGILPSDGRVTAPVSGTVVTAMDSGHAYGIKTADGVEVLVHIGIDTVQLGGQHFVRHVVAGDVVTAGDLLADVDLTGVSAAGYDTMTIMVVTNTRKFTAVAPVAQGTVAIGAPALTVEI